MKRALAVGVRSFSSGAARPFYFSYLGVENSFSHLAFQSLQQRVKVPLEGQGVPTLQHLVDSLRDGQADMGILPLESTSAGPVAENSDALLRHRLASVADFAVQERHVLAARPGVRLEDVRRVFSHQSVFQQCSDFLRQLEKVNGRLSVRGQASSPESAQALWKNYGARPLPDAAAICSIEGATANGLEVLVDGVGNAASRSQMRYAVVVPRERAASAHRMQEPLRVQVSVNAHA
jgi:chorismate mutase/prephenate dehydratase